MSEARPDETDDEAWAAIVASLTGSDFAPDITEEDLDRPPPPPDAAEPAHSGRDGAPAGWRLPHDPGEATVPGRNLDRDDHFVPPVPPPVTWPDAVTGLAWVGLLGGPVFLVVAAVLGMDLRTWVTVVCIGGFVGGFALLLSRMRDQPPSDDDGAVV